MYRATYKEESGKLLSNSVIKLYPSGERMKFAPDIQDKVTYEYLDYESDMTKLKNHKINQEVRSFQKYAVEGIIENVEEVWIHPMRQNQYLFTEVAPFPEVELPLVVGEEWESTLNIQEGWGEWSNTSGESKYKVIKKDTFSLANKVIDCWLINAESTFPFGRSKLSYKFHEDYGFVLMDYVNYEKETLSIRMVRVEE